MNNQHPSAVDAFVVAANGFLLALLGVDYYAMVWAFLGALIAHTQMEKMTRPHAIILVLLSTLVGAMLGSAAAAFLGVKHPALIGLLSLTGATGWQGFIALLVKLAEARIKSFFPGANQ